MNTSKPPSAATALRHAGNRRERCAGAVNPPVVRASTVLFEDMAHLRRASARPFDEFYYGRFGTPTHEALAEALQAISGAAGTVFFPSGLAAIAGVLLSLLHSGDELLVADNVYGPTRHFCQQQLARFGISCRFFPARAGAEIESLIRPETRLIFCESPGSLTMEMQDIPAIGAVAQAHKIPLAVDNTWGTPLQYPVLQMGASVDIQAGTKYIGGHADLMLGAALCQEDVFATVRKQAQSYGYCVSADEAWLALRGLRTLDMRLQQQAANARRVKTWLREQPECREILDPSEPGHPQHELWRRDCRGANGLFSVALEGLSARAVDVLVDALEWFGLGYSWGGYESLILPFDPNAQGRAERWPEQRQYLRLHIGLENPEELITDLGQAFAQARVASVDSA